MAEASLLLCNAHTTPVTLQRKRFLGQHALSSLISLFLPLIFTQDTSPGPMEVFILLTSIL